MDDEQRILVMSPLYYDNEDKIQEEYYKDVRKPSTLQSRPPSVASSLRDEPASAALLLRVRATSSVCIHLLLLDQFEEMLVPCSLKTTTDPPLSAAKAELPCGPRDSRHHHPAAEDNRSKARVR